MIAAARRRPGLQPSSPARLHRDPVAGAVRDGSAFTQRAGFSPDGVVAEQRAGRRPAGVLRAESRSTRSFGWLSYDWITSLPGGFNENVASLPWVALVAIVRRLCFWAGFRPMKGWVVFTFIVRVAGARAVHLVAKQLTYVPTPWAMLRYLPIIGAARMPTRLTMLVMLGVAMMLALARARICGAARGIRGSIAAAIGGLLLRRAAAGAARAALGRDSVGLQDDRRRPAADSRAVAAVRAARRD